MGMYGDVRTVVRCRGGRTRQSEKEACDINRIVARYVKTGALSHINEYPPVFADVSEMGDYRTAIEQVRRSEAYFAGLPSKLRAHFRNDPAEFLDFVSSHEKGELEALAGRVLSPERLPDPPKEGEGVPA